MKRFLKSFVFVIAAVMLLAATFSFAGCEDLKTMTITVSVYDIDDQTETTETITVTLYRHLAPETVDAISSYAKEGYYNDTFFYKMSGYSSQLMIGDLKNTSGTAITQNAEKPTINGEFEQGGVTGSDLTNVSGNIGLWRTWYAGNYGRNTSGFDTGSSTLYLPTSSISSYDGYFCIFGVLGTDDDTTEAIDLIKALFNSTDYYQTYVVYYTGTDPENLTFNICLDDDFNEEDITDLFDSEEYLEEHKDALVYDCYDYYNVSVPMYKNKISAKIKSITIG